MRDNFEVARIGGRPGQDRPDDWFAVMVKCHNEDGREYPAVITQFSVREEAGRLVGLLNQAYDDFHAGRSRDH